MSAVVAALFVQPRGVYAGLADVDVWDEKRDARKYAGPHPVVAHPPSQRYGRFATKGGRKVGDDGGCFAAALAAVRQYGGVLEHPAHTKAFRLFHIPEPHGPWWQLVTRLEAGYAWVCEVHQGRYGYPARKETWLYYVGRRDPAQLDWAVADVGRRVASGRCGVKILSKSQRERTPLAFAEVLLALARGAP